MSNTSIGRGMKGSKFWIQTLVNTNNGSKLNNQINKIDATIGSINWLSPISKDNYRELKTNEISGVLKDQLNFWPDNGPWWDGVGKTGNGSIILIEAKAHVKETYSKCTATSKVSKTLIESSMLDAHNYLSKNHIYSRDVWFDKYYQLGNRLTFLVNLKKLGINVKLVLLNIVEDPTHISTTEAEWESHYKDVFREMLGADKTPDGVIIVNFKV